MKQVVPDFSSEDSKKKQVADMFDNISPYYDFLNRLLSVGIDVSWRKKAIGLLRPLKPRKILDVATGTGDMAIEALRALEPEKIIGVDISEGMLEVGRTKVKGDKLKEILEFQYADSENLPFDDNSFDAVTVAFGVRNFENLAKGLSEMNRVLKPGGHIVILEFSKPSKFPVKQAYDFYFYNVLPLVGKIISKNSKAYSYLPESVANFPSGDNFETLLKDAGFYYTSTRTLTYGICSLYSGQK